MREHGDYFRQPSLRSQHFSGKISLSVAVRRKPNLQTTVHMYIHCIYLQERGRRHDCRILQMGQ